eukprot:6189339-Prymnesium_polylepis.1
MAGASKWDTHAALFFLFLRVASAPRDAMLPSAAANDVSSQASYSLRVYQRERAAMANKLSSLYGNWDQVIPWDPAREMCESRR